MVFSRGVANFQKEISFELFFKFQHLALEYHSDYPRLEDVKFTRGSQQSDCFRPLLQEATRQ